MAKKEDIISNDLEYEIKRLTGVISRLEIEADEAYQRGYQRGYKAGYKEAEMEGTYYEDEDDEQEGEIL